MCGCHYRAATGSSASIAKPGSTSERIPLPSCLNNYDETPAQLPKHKVKYKKPLQRACNEKNEKGKFCGGHLKRWSTWPT